MAGELEKELLAVLAKHGVAGVQKEAVPAVIRNPGQVASYIKEIVGGEVAFDEDVLQRVAAVLNKGTTR